MSKFRIKAFFMHETEEAAARRAVEAAAVTEAEWTAGYLMGVIDETEIESLANQGLVVSLIEQVGPGDGPPAGVMRSPAMFGFNYNVPRSDPTGPQEGRALPVTTVAQTPDGKILSRDRRRSNYYVVRFHGPVTKERKKELGNLRVRLLERLSRNHYTVHLKPSQVGSLAVLPFVDSVSLYTKEETLPASQGATASSGPKKRAGMYLVKLHRAKDLPVVVRWLARQNRKPLWKRKDYLQIALVEGSKTLTDLAARPEVARIEPVSAPRLCDGHAREVLGLTREKVSIGLRGDGEIIGVADTGIDRDHPDLKARIAGVKAWGRDGDSSDPEGHGTHVAGCAVGDGTASNGEVLGAAPRAKVFFQSILDPEGRLGGLRKGIGKLLKEAYDAGARVHNNSWGAFTFARYAPTSLEIDRFVAEFPDMLVVIAAGNDGIGVPRGTGEKVNAAKGFVDWPSVAAPGSAKNGLTVGASRSSRTSGGYATLTWNDAWPNSYPDAPIADQLISSDPNCLAAFSSRGPVDLSLIKPDVVAPGTDIAAARSKDAPLYKFWGAYPKNNRYAFMGGTSMAAPYVAGCAALVREWYRTQGGWPTPSAALLKATLLNGAQRMDGIDAVAPETGEPNFHQGFGRIDMSATVPNPLTQGLKLVFDDGWRDPARAIKETGQRFRYQIRVGSALDLRICLTWTDPPARTVQNTLLLLADNAHQTKWVGNAQAATLLNVSGGPRDPNNNVQVVRVANPPPGIYTIAVVANMILTPPQSFALVVTGELQSSLTRV